MRLLWFNLVTDVDDSVLGFTTSWIRAVAKTVERIYVITMRAGRIEVPENVEVYSVGKEKGYSEPRRAAKFYCHLWRVLRYGQVDACFSHMIPIFSVLAAPVLKAKGIPIVTWYAHPSLTKTLKLAHELSDRVVASMATSYPYKHDKLVVVGQGIDTELFRPDGTAPDSPPLILCVGRLSPVKDHPTLLKAIALLKERFEKPFRVVILGSPASPRDNEYVRDLQQTVEDLGLQDLVHFRAAVPMHELPIWYRRCTVHVNLTPTGSGDKVAWEAMACGRPCVVANEGFRQTLGRYEAKLLFRFGAPEPLVERFLWALCLGEHDRDAIGAYLRQRVVNGHSLERLSGKLTDLFEECVNRAS